MRSRSFYPPFYFRVFATLACMLLALMLIGCSQSAPELDTSMVTSPTGKKGVCHHVGCKKEISEVTEEHLIVVRGNQYIVCDEKCEADLKVWLSKQ